MSTSQARKPKGTPTGGQFAQMSRAEAGTVLDADADGGPAPLKEIDRGVFVVADTVTKPLSDDVVPGARITRTEITIGGRPERRAETGLVALALERDAGSDEDDLKDQLRSIAATGDGKATVLVRHRSGSVQAVEGKVLHEGDSDGSLALLSKGSRSKGFYLFRDRSPKVLAVEPGYGKASKLAERYRQAAANLPTLDEATFDGIPEWSDNSDEPPSEVAAAYVLDHPGFDGSQDGRGVVYLATDRDAGNGIVNGYMICPDSSGLVSEHGSMLESDLARMGGRVVGYQPGSLSFSDAIRLSDEPVERTWAAIAGRS
jgi:hypothetical protein